MKEKIFLVDLDGTIINSSRGILNSFDYAFEKMGVLTPSKEILKSFIGPPLHDSFGLYFEGKDIQKAVEVFREYYSEKGMFEIEVYEGVEETIKTLSESCKCKLFVATSKDDKHAKEIIKNIGLDKYFEKVVGSSADGTFSEKADIIRYILDNEIENTDEYEIFMVGDTKFDIIGANKNGINSIGVLYGFGSEEDLREAGATYIVEKLTDILEIK